MQPTVDEFPKKAGKYIISDVILGKGQFGIVRKAWLEENKEEQYAVKVIPLSMINDQKLNLKLLTREIDIMKKLTHPNLVRLKDAWQGKNSVYMLMDFCKGGNLKQLREKEPNKSLPYDKAMKYFKDIVAGLKFLYENHIVHRDLKPENILLHDGVAKISDFGFARIVDENMETTANMTALGTPLYTAPQVMGAEKFSAKCDLWSVGIMFYEILYGKTPFFGKTIPALVKEQKNPLTFPPEPKVDEKMKKIISQLLAYKDEDRIHFADFFAHELWK